METKDDILEKKAEPKNRRDIVLDEFIEGLKRVNYKVGAVLDVGAADNYNRERIEKEGLHWIGMDIIQGKDVSIKGKMEDIPFHDGVITCIICSHVFEHTIDPLKTLKEFKRVLWAGGLLFLVTPTPTFHQIFTMDSSHYFVFNKDQLINLLQKSGFIVVRTREEKDDGGHNNILLFAVSV